MNGHKVVILTGMHRSGTSLAAQWMHRCGLHLGEELLGAHIGNNDGHFEDMDFLRLHEKILDELKLPTTGLIATPLPPLKQEQQQALGELIRQKMTVKASWGWKEPRTCLFLPYYQKILPSAFYLILIRDYEVVVSSLILRLFKLVEKKYAAKKGIAKWLWNRYKRKRRIRYLLRKKASLFLQSWIRYNQAICALVRDCYKEDYLITDQQTLMKHSKAVYDYMQAHGAIQDLQYTAFADLFKPSLQSKVLDIRSFISDKNLLQEAEAIQAWLQERLFKDERNG